ncbi:Uncharacterised protein [Mycobacteroides abscessus subsp. massiliense]|uniref:hypothetical protein n=1 Tax=Mycobacteroides abscessus TaxID=36809 RepID=UPI0009C82841|nr:hypothetical protein [Mycobacteroides abscessus]SKK75353.1 Uncharacterised protein [Mycobacteroides abscessus subsp. massiliense]SKL00804.1 Uncharacterised protein [Mycobacteroides abscessus subsp. massiliense]SKM11288.1 Uncharacterised protein [Mycobacteroides abscessus subsp. massiliense]
MSDIDAGPGGQESTQNDEQAPPDVVTPDVNSEPAETKPDTFTREYVEGLRKENRDARVKAKETEQLARKVHTALVVATGKLVNAEELPFDPEHLTDAEKLNAAIDALTEAKPYLRVRPAGDVGQGQRGNGEPKPTWGDLFRRA